ncbi:hypothetical protein D1BOALGB6SA_1852 [Olavius sp. associated proteobacterium Delta 1]|nr:hypothetical protein D1BOALGB6SA_1852 [Olavius sp. associated proteobacterium Delta 1]
MKLIQRPIYILMITAAIAFISLLMGTSTALAGAKTQDELINTIIQIAKDEYHKHSYKWTDYEKQFTLNMSEDEFAAFCIGTARYEHRRGRKWNIDWQAKIPIYNPSGRLVSYDIGVMQINSRTGKTYFHALDYENNISDNIRAGVKHLAAGFNQAYFKGFGGLDAINYGLQFYNPYESNRVKKIWHYIPKYKKPPPHNISIKVPAGFRSVRRPDSWLGTHDGRLFIVK